MLRNFATSAEIARHESPFLHFGRLATLAGSWMEYRRSRHALAQLDERLLRDIGLTPAEAIAESVLPFWRPSSRRRSR